MATAATNKLPPVDNSQATSSKEPEAPVDPPGANPSATVQSTNPLLSQYQALLAAREARSPVEHTVCDVLRLSPIHSVAYAVTCSVVALKVLCVLLLLPFIFVTVSETLNLFYAFDGLKSSGGIETSIVYKPPSHFNDATFCFSVNARELGQMNGVEREQTNTAPAEWNSTDESVLPAFNPSLTYRTAKMFANIVHDEFKLLRISTEKNAETMRPAMLNMLSGQLQQSRASPTHKFWSLTKVNFDLLFRTVAVVLCRTLAPQAIIGERFVTADQICTKANVEFHPETDCSRYAREDAQVITFAFRIPRYWLVSSVRGVAAGRAEISIYRLAQDMPVGACPYGLRAATELNQIRLVYECGGGREYAHSLALVTTTRTIQESVQRGGKNACRESRDPLESDEECVLRCALSDRSCGCRMLIGRLSSDTGRTCPEDEKAVEHFPPQCNLSEHCDRLCDKSARCTTATQVRERYLIGNDRMGSFGDGRARLSGRNLGSAYHILMREYGAMDEVGFRSKLGQILGIWTGSSLMACAHLVLGIAVCVVCAIIEAIRRCVSKRFSRPRHDRTGNHGNEVATPKLYFHFLSHAIQARGLERLILLAAIATGFAMFLLDVNSRVECFYFECTQSTISFVRNRVFVQAPALCFEFGQFRASSQYERQGMTDRHLHANSLKTYYQCLSLLMNLEQSVFKSPSNQSAPIHLLAQCAHVLGHITDPSATDQRNEVPLAAMLASQICKAMNLNVLIDGFRGDSLHGCDQHVSPAWLGPYAPFRSDSLCFTLPPISADTTYHVTFSRSPESVLYGQDERSQFEVRLHLVGFGYGSFLQTPDRVAQDAFPINVMRDWATLAEIVQTHAFQHLNLLRFPCDYEDTSFSCERRCRNEYLLQHCNYSSVSFGENVMGVRALLSGLLPSTMQCLSIVQDSRRSDYGPHYSDIDRCTMMCRWRRPCTQLRWHVKEKSFYSQGAHDNYLVVIRMAKDVSTFSVVDSLYFTGVESLIVDLGGMNALWLGGSVVAVWHIILVLVERLVNKCRLRKRRLMMARAPAIEPARIQLSAHPSTSRPKFAETAIALPGAVDAAGGRQPSVTTGTDDPREKLRLTTRNTVVTTLSDSVPQCSLPPLRSDGRKRPLAASIRQKMRQDHLQLA